MVATDTDAQARMAAQAAQISCMTSASQLQLGQEVWLFPGSDYTREPHRRFLAARLPGGHLLAREQSLAQPVYHRWETLYPDLEAAREAQLLVLESHVRSAQAALQAAQERLAQHRAAVALKNASPQSATAQEG